MVLDAMAAITEKPAIPVTRLSCRWNSLMNLSDEVIGVPRYCLTYVSRDNYPAVCIVLA